MTESIEREPRYETSVITGTALKERIYRNGVVDERFSPLENGVFEFSPLNTARPLTDERVRYAVLEKNGEIVGLAQLFLFPHHKDLGLSTVSVDKNLFGQRLSEKLLREVFRYAKAESRRIFISSYTESGEERIQKRIDALAKEFGVEIYVENRLA